MITKMYSVFDSKAAIFGVPFFYLRDEIALRAFGDLVNEPGTLPSRHPEDFSLFYIGEFDDFSGEVIPCKHVNLGNAAGFKVTPIQIPLPIGNGERELVR